MRRFRSPLPSSTPLAFSLTGPPSELPHLTPPPSHPFLSNHSNRREIVCGEKNTDSANGKMQSGSRMPRLPVWWAGQGRGLTECLRCDFVPEKTSRPNTQTQVLGIFGRAGAQGWHSADHSGAQQCRAPPRSGEDYLQILSYSPRVCESSVSIPVHADRWEVYRLRKRPNEIAVRWKFNFTLRPSRFLQDGNVIRIINPSE